MRVYVRGLWLRYGEKGSEAKPEKEKSDHLVMAWWGNQVRNEKTQAATG